MAKKEQTHESLITAITDAEKALEVAKAEYKEFCKDNPLQMPKQPTLHELRLMREKNDKASLAEHQKANALAVKAAKAEK